MIKLGYLDVVIANLRQKEVLPTDCLMHLLAIFSRPKYVLLLLVSLKLLFRGFQSILEIAESWMLVRGWTASLVTGAMDDF